MNFKEKVITLLESGPQRTLYRYVDSNALKKILEVGAMESGKYYDDSLTNKLEIPTTRASNLNYRQIKILSTYAGIFKIIIQWDVMNDKIRNLGLQKTAEYPISYKNEMISAFMDGDTPTEKNKKEFEALFKEISKRFPSVDDLTEGAFKNFVNEKMKFMGTTREINIVRNMFIPYKRYLLNIRNREREERIVRKDTPSVEGRAKKYEEFKNNRDKKIPINTSWFKIDLINQIKSINDFDMLTIGERANIKSISSLIENNKQYFTDRALRFLREFNEK